MLVQSRHKGEWIKIGENAYIMVVNVEGSKVRLGIVAPDDIKILRGELTGEPFPMNKDAR
jgi:carbon storage regulator